MDNKRPPNDKKGNEPKRKPRVRDDQGETDSTNPTAATAAAQGTDRVAVASTSQSGETQHEAAAAAAEGVNAAAAATGNGASADEATKNQQGVARNPTPPTHVEQVTDEEIAAAAAPRSRGRSGSSDSAGPSHSLSSQSRRSSQDDPHPGGAEKRDPKKPTYNSLTREQLARTVDALHCATPNCATAGKDKGGFMAASLNAVSHTGISVMLCGHLLCQPCQGIAYNKTRNQSSSIFECPMCQQEHPPTEVSDMPSAVHAVALLKDLKKPGIPCGYCKNTPWMSSNPVAQGMNNAIAPFVGNKTSQYPSDFVVICRSCKEDPSQARQHSSALVESEAVHLTCLICAMAHDKMEIHAENPADFTLIGKAGNEDEAAAANSMGLAHMPSRAPSHLAFPSRPALAEFMSTALHCCKCRQDYGIAYPHIHPRLLDCGHMLCSDCAAQNMNDNEEYKCQYQTCSKTKTRNARPVPHLSWAMGRKMKDFVKCKMCEEYHTMEISPEHRDPVMPAKWQKCEERVCLYCRMNEEEFSKHSHT